MSEAEKLIEQLQSLLGGPTYECTSQRDGKACTRQHEGVDKKGQLKLYFSIGCKVVESFCPACRAYWLVAVARNELLTYRRRCAAMVAEDGQMEREGAECGQKLYAGGKHVDTCHKPRGTEHDHSEVK